jgi:hypothetical protein
LPVNQPRADTAAATLLRRVEERVRAGEGVASAFSEEFVHEAVFYRTGSLFTNELPVSRPCRIDEEPQEAILGALRRAFRGATANPDLEED